MPSETLFTQVDVNWHKYCKYPPKICYSGVKLLAFYLTLSQMLPGNFQIVEWRQIRKHFKGADLLLDNGFSIALNSRFHYDSFFAEFIKQCSRDDRCIFERVGTSNFESIQQQFQNAIDISRLCGQETSKIQVAVDKLRNGLVQTIQRTHPKATEIDGKMMGNVAKQLNDFENVFTLSYDLYMYRLIMELYDLRKQLGERINRFNDRFYRYYSGDSRYNEFQKEQKLDQFKHVYYLHGALFIFSRGGGVLKIKRQPGQELIECIGHEIEQGNLPLIVSEGDWKIKESQIRDNDYLGFALDQLKDAGDKIVCYGTSLSVQDQHIINALNEKERQIAVSIYVPGKTGNELMEEMSRL